MDAGGRLHPDGWVLIGDGAILAVGSGQDPGPAAAGATRVDTSGCVVVPGLINTHQHHWYNLFKGLGSGMLLEQWIENLLRPTAAAIGSAEIEVAARLAALEMLAGGTTTCLNHSVTASDSDLVAATLEPVVESGMRQLFAKEVRPDRLDQQLELAAEIHHRWDGAGEGRIAIGLVLESTAHWVAMGTSSEQLLLRGNELAARLGARISDHVAGGTMSRESGYLRSVLATGRTDFELLHDLGILDEKWILAHAINAYDRDIELLAASGASVAHTPTSESARGGGVAPIKRFREAGVRVALGSDGPMVDTSVEMVEQMKAATLLQNQLHRDPLALSAEEALAMATREAAAALGLEAEIGSIEPGKRADLVVFDLADPVCAVWHDPVAALVGSRPRPRQVFVDGVELVRDGDFTRVGSEEVAALIAEAEARAAELLARADVPAARGDASTRSGLGAIV